jgi:phosphomannomutase
MTLIKSISGIRGTIGGKPGEGLSPLDLVKFTAAFFSWIKENNPQAGKLKVVVGRDARISGEMVNSVVVGTLMGMGADVINIGLASTPSTEIAVVGEKASGGIILTASHNPKQWNALKLLNSEGEFLNAAEGERVLEIAASENFSFAEVDNLGLEIKKDYTDIHISQVLGLKLVDVDSIRKAGFTVGIDAVNSVGGIIVPRLLKALGVKEIVEINCESTGHFAHTPEPIPENLGKTLEMVRNEKMDVCFVVDPDVDRLAIINEDGSWFNEEYTLVAVADYILSKKKGNSVSNLSSSVALKDITEKHGGSYTPSAVGEVNVVSMMKSTNAVIGGEGNGGVIYPESHYGRDALVGIGLFLSHLAQSGLKCSELRNRYPDYFISKNKIELTPQINVDEVLRKIKSRYNKEKLNDTDGIRIDFDHEWVHLRKSNTEPIIRIYSESSSSEKASNLANKIIGDIKDITSKI